MDGTKFDTLAQLFGTGNSRRRAVTLLGGGALAALLGRPGAPWAPEEAAAACAKPGKRCGDGKKCCKGAKCKRGRCKCANGGVACGGACCGTDEVCVGGTCLTQCPRCRAGEECLDGTCVVREGTCPAGADHCNSVEFLCNAGGAGDCFCLPTPTGDVRCMQNFVPGSACGACQSDADCAAVEAGAVCVAPAGGGCPCQAGQGICARRCPTSTP